MQSKNKKPMTTAERRHVEIIKAMPCAVCGECPESSGSEAHEIEQGQWFTTIPLCADCHRGEKNGLHGQRAMWKVMRKTELVCLNDTIKTLMNPRRSRL